MSWRTLTSKVQVEAARLIAWCGQCILATIQTCKACRQKNRVLWGRRKPRCGRCGFPLKEEAKP